MTEPVLILSWLSSVLTTDTTLNDTSTGVKGGWHRRAPANARSPYAIVRQLTAAEDLTGLNNGVLIWSPNTFQINLYDRDQQNIDDFTRLDPLAQRIYALLQAASGQPTGGIIYGCHRLNTKIGDETLEGGAVELYINQTFMIEAKSG